MIAIVVGLRFLLEMVTVLGIFSGVWWRKKWLEKIFFVVLAMVITLIWARFGAPKSAHVLTGIAKLSLELAVYLVGTVSFYFLFGSRIGLIYFVLAFGDLVLIYGLGLAGV